MILHNSIQNTLFKINKQALIFFFFKLEQAVSFVKKFV